jgi:hypothetical protein
VRHVTTTMLVIVAVIHLLPLAGVFGGERLAVLYGLAFDEPNLAILMRHRAVLFGLLGAFLLLAAFRRNLQLLAFAAASVSTLSFLWLASSVGNYNSEVGRVFTADIAALVCLAVGLAAYCFPRGRTV